MAAIDLESKCKSLGISVYAISNAMDKELTFLSNIHDDLDHYGEYKEFLDEDELVAIIRWRNLHKRYPNLFTWDGAVE